MASDGLIRIDIEVDGQQITAATNALNSLGAAATGSSGGINSTSNSVNQLGSASANAANNASGAAGSLNDMSNSANSASNSAQNAAQQTQNMGNESQRASIGIREIATSLGLVAVASAAFGALKGALDGAISRFDTLAGFPVVMERMGFSSEQAEESISKLSEGIQGLPTTLNGIVSSTQKIAILTGDLETATDTALSLNNAFLASGSSAADAERGLTQYVQMLSKGSVDLMSWRTLQETMGYALKETAAAFGFTGSAAQNDLYDALKDGDVVFSDFNAKLIELNNGVGGFADMAATGSEGIATSLGNLKNAVTVGVANIIKSFDNLSQATTGKSIYKNIDGLKVIISSSFKAIGSVIESAAPAVIAFAGGVKASIPVIKALTPVIIGLVAAYAAFTVASKAAAAIEVARVAISGAQTATRTLTIVTAAQTTAQMLLTGATQAEIATRLAQVSTISVSTFAIGVLTGKIGLATAATVLKTAATYAWGVAVKFLMGPIGWITAGIGLLVTGVIAVVKWFKKSSEEAIKLNGATEKLGASTKALNDSMSETSTAHEKNIGNIEATATANAGLVTKIEELLAVEGKSAAHKKELQSYVETLNGSVDGLSLAYSKEANSLNMTSEEIAAKITLMKEQEGLIVGQERFLAIAKEQAEVDLQLKDVLALKKEAAQDLADEVIKKGDAKEATAALDEQEKALMETKAGLAAQQIETEKQVTASIEAVATATANSVTDQVASYAFLSDRQKDVVDSLKATWEDYKTKATDMFDVIETKSKISVSQLTKNLEANQKAVTEWSENIAKLSKSGIDEGLLATLRDAGPEAAGLVNTLVASLESSSDKEFLKLSATFAKGADVAKEALATSMGKDNAKVMDSVGHLVTEAGLSLTQQIQGADFESLGAAIPEGTASGVVKGTKDVAEASKKMADETEKAFRGALEIKSPSGVFKGFGDNITEGAKLGVTEGTPAVVKTMQELSTAMKKPFLNFSSEFSTIGTNTTNGLNQGLIAGQGKVLATARGIASSVATTMRKELDIHSPSRVTTKIGSQTGAGFLKGLKGAEKAIEKAAKKSAKKAVSGTKKGAAAAKKAANAQVAAAKKAASAAKAAETAAFKNPLDTANYKYKMGQIDSSEFIKSLEKTRDAYAKTPDQIRKVNLQIASVQKASAKALEKQKNDAIKDGYENSKNFIEKRKRDGEISLSAELNAWLRVQDRYKLGSKERIDAEKNVARVRIEIAKAEFDAAKDAIDTRKYYNQMSLTEELVAWQQIQTKYLAGTKEREEADRNVYRVKKEINAQLVALNESYGKKLNDISNKLAADELKTNEDTAKGIASIRENLNKEIIKSNEDLANKTKAITEKSLADQQREMDNYLKSVEDSYNKLNNFNGGIFNYFEMEPAEDGQGLIEILESQLDGLNEWEKQLADLSDSAIDKGLLEELRAMGPKALPELMAFNNMTAEQLEKYSALYQEKSAKARALADKENAGLKADTERRMQEMREAANAELSQLQYDTQMHVAAMRQAADSEISQMQYDAAQRISEMRATANAELDVLKTEWVAKIGEINKTTKEELDDLKVIGKNAAQGLLDGMGSMEGALVAKATSIAEAVKTAMALALDVRSPSRWMRDMIGKNMMLGWMIGMDSEKSATIAKAKEAADWMKPDVEKLGGMVSDMVAVTIPNINLAPMRTKPQNNRQSSNEPNGGGSTYSPTFINHFDREIRTPSEVARANKRQSERQAMEMGVFA